MRSESPKRLSDLRNPVFCSYSVLTLRVRLLPVCCPENPVYVPTKTTETRICAQTKGQGYFRRDPWGAETLS
jgi:hypothetical protein